MRETDKIVQKLHNFRYRNGNRQASGTNQPLCRQTNHPTDRWADRVKGAPSYRAPKTPKTLFAMNKAQRPTMRPQEFWGISSYLSTAIATFGGTYTRELL